MTVLYFLMALAVVDFVMAFVHKPLLKPGRYAQKVFGVNREDGYL